jgi:hypothetical protein
VVLQVPGAVDLDVHPRLAHLPEVVVGLGRTEEQLLELAGGVAPDPHRGVDDEVDGAVHSLELGGHRVDEERHVVGDDLDDGVPAGPALLLDLGVVDGDVGGAHGSPLRELAVREGGAEQVLRCPREQVLGGDVAVVGPQELLDALTPAVVCALRCGVQQLLTGLVQRR